MTTIDFTNAPVAFLSSYLNESLCDSVERPFNTAEIDTLLKQDFIFPHQVAEAKRVATENEEKMKGIALAWQDGYLVLWHDGKKLGSYRGSSVDGIGKGGLSESDIEYVRWLAGGE